MPAITRITQQMEAQSGTSGLATLFDSQRAELLYFLTARCGDASDAHDLLQELWIRISTQATGPIANPRGYLFRMANNLALNQSRTRRRAMARDRAWLSGGDQGDIAIEERPDPEPPADEVIARRQEAELLHKAISALPPGAQRALRLYRLEGHEQKEVARIMGISPSGVEKHLAVAMKHLRSALAECGWLAPAVSVEGQVSTTVGRERKNDHDGA